ncbi:MAG: glycosyltransferase family 39 protein [Anaerolineales bacterium]|nr:glycosyltransferase family 39 protein [Anaerolineales bacterium]
MSFGAVRLPFSRHSSLVLRVALLALLLVAFGLRVLRLDFQELRGDEAFGYFFSQQGFGEIIGATLALREPHPVASYFLQKLWMSVAGAGEYALRFQGVGWGLLAVALIYRLGRRTGFGAWGAALAALLLALSPYAIWHAQDARMYPMSLALTLAAVYFGLEALQRQRWPWITAYVLAAWLALHTHYYARVCPGGFERICDWPCGLRGAHAVTALLLVVVAGDRRGAVPPVAYARRHDLVRIRGQRGFAGHQ